METYHVFISDGKLFVHDDNGTREILSKFAEEKASEAEMQKEFRSWKSGGGQESSYFNAATIWGGQASIRPF